MVFSDRVFVDLVVKHYHGKSFLGSVVSVTGLTKELEQILIQLRPGGVIPQLQEVKSTQSGKPSSHSKVSDVMAAISGLNSDEKLQIKAALFGMTTDTGVKDTYGGSKAFGLPKKVESQKVVISLVVLHKPQYGQMNQLSGIAPLPASAPHLDQTFHFGNSNTVHNIRVTTFSGSAKDCSFEQFRYDVQCLVNQGCPEGMVLTAMKMFDDNIKNALRHKFDTFAGSPQFIIEARKIDSEFKTAKLKAQQQQMITDPTPSFQKGLDEILQRLSSLEKKIADKTVTDPAPGTLPASGNSFGAGQTQGNTRPKVPRKNWKDI